MTQNNSLAIRPEYFDETSLLESLFNNFPSFSSSLSSSTFPSSGRRSGLICSPFRTEEGMAVTDVEVPGVDPKDIKVHVEGRSLTVETPKGRAYMTLGQRLNGDEVTASLKHGLLTIRIPKREARVIQVEVHEE